MTDQQTNSDVSKPRHNMYPLPTPPPPPEGAPVKAIGINKRCEQTWNPSSSHLITFSDKDDTYGKPPTGEITPIWVNHFIHDCFTFYILFISTQ